MKQQNINWKDYENITKYIYETLEKEYNVIIECHGANCKITGKSGLKHQIDVLTSVIDGSKKCLTAIECKYLNKKVDKGTVMKLLSLMNDTDIKRGVIVSKNGFTRDALQLAKYHNISIVQLREAKNTDMNIKKDIHIFDLGINYGIKSTRPKLLSIIATDINNERIVLDEKHQYNIIIESKNGTKRRLFDDIMMFKKHLQDQIPFKKVVKEYNIENSKLFFNNKTYTINSIVYTGLLTTKDVNFSKTFSIVDKVSFIMKKIFEEQTFIITKDGIIVNTTNNSDYLM